MKEITSVEQLKALLETRQEKTETYHVLDGLEETIRDNLAELRPSSNMRQMTPEEVEDVARYLEVEVDQIQLGGPFLVNEDMVCPQCGRKGSFLDIAKTAIESGIHTKEMVRDIILGKQGMVLSISGKNHDRQIKCADCEQVYPQRSYYNRPTYDWS